MSMSGMKIPLSKDVILCFEVVYGCYRTQQVPDNFLSMFMNKCSSSKKMAVSLDHFLRTLIKVSLGISTFPISLIFFLPSANCLNNLFFLVTSPPYCKQNRGKYQNIFNEKEKCQFNCVYDLSFCSSVCLYFRLSVRLPVYAHPVKVVYMQCFMVLHCCCNNVLYFFYFSGQS